MKRFTLILAVFILACLVTACTNEKDESHAQGIEVIDVASGETKSVLTTDQEIDEFVDTVLIDGWKIENRPDNAVAETEFVLNVQETIKLGEGKDDVSLTTGATLTTYKDIDYVTVDVKGFHLDLKVTAQAAEYLHSFQAAENG